MKVIIHQANSFLTKDKTIDDFIFSTIAEMCKMQATQAFIWLSYDNVLPVTHDEAIKHIMLKTSLFAGLWKPFWQNRQLGSVIKSQKPSCILWLNGNEIKTPLPQCILITQVNNKTSKNVLPGTAIITLSHYLKQQLEKRGHNSERIHVMRPKASKMFAPADWDTRESIKHKYASGTEYFFLFTNHTTAEQVLQALKAFSLFKKWQKSAARLLIYTEDNSTSAKWKKTLLSYKFREDVIVQHPVNDEEGALIIACAMCALYLPGQDDTGLHLMECLQAQVPVITHNIGAIAETVEDAALYCSAEDVQDIADKMKRIYRDEKLRTQLAGRIIEAAAKNHNSNPSQQLWKVIQNTAGPTAVEAENP